MLEAPNVDSRASPNDDEGDKSPCGLFASTPRSWRGTLRRLPRAGCINWGVPNISDPRLNVGAFCVGEKDGSLRLICNRRVRSFREQVLHKARMHSGPHFCRILLPQTHAMRLSGRGPKDFYHIRGVEAARYPKQCFGGGPSNWFSLRDSTLDDHGELEDCRSDDLESILRVPRAPAVPPILCNQWQ